MSQVVVTIDYCGFKNFTRRSGRTGQEVLVSSGSIYPAVISAVDKEDFDFSLFKQGDRLECSADIVFTSVQCVSDSGKKYYKRMATIKLIDGAVVNNK